MVASLSARLLTAAVRCRHHEKHAEAALRRVAVAEDIARAATEAAERAQAELAAQERLRTERTVAGAAELNLIEAKLERVQSAASEEARAAASCPKLRPVLCSIPWTCQRLSTSWSSSDGFVP